MKLVIDIPENVYTRLFDNGIQDNEIAVDDVCDMARSLRLGIPYLEGEWISEKIEEEDWKGCKRQYYQPISCSKCHSPNHYKSTYCPNCGTRMKSEDD